MLLTVPQRRRFIADLRLAGLRAVGRCSRLVLFDALVLGAVASALGLLLGDVLSRHALPRRPGLPRLRVPVGDQRIVTSQQRAARRSAAASPRRCSPRCAAARPLLAARRSRAVPRRRRRAGDARVRRRWPRDVACLAATTAILLLAPSAAVVGRDADASRCCCSCPCCVRARRSRLLDALHAHPVPTLALLELRSASGASRARSRSRRRARSPSSRSVAIGGAHARPAARARRRGARDRRHGRRVGRRFPGAANAFATTPFSAAAGRRRGSRACPAWSAVRPYRGSFLDVGDRRVWVLAPPRDAPAPIPREPARRGRRRAGDRRACARGGWAVLSDAVASERGARRRRPRHAADAAAGRAAASRRSRPTSAGRRARVIVNADDYARAWGDAAPSALQVALAPGASPRGVARGGRGARWARRAGSTVETARAPRGAPLRGVARRGSTA